MSGMVVAQDITFHHLTTDEGLSQSSVVTLYQDEIGFIWIGTREGLNRYDGNNISTYRLQKNDPNSLFCNNILKITGNKKGKIYLLTTEGICEYDLKLDRFKTLWKDAEITAIHCYKDKLYVGKGSKIYTYNEVGNEFDLYYQLPSSDTNISTLFIDTKASLYIGSSNRGLYVLDAKKNLRNPIASNNNITSIYEDSEAKIWVGSWENGLYMLSVDKISNFVYRPNDSKSISSNFVRACSEDNQGNIWIGTFNGLNKYDQKTGEFTHYGVTDKPDGLTHSSVWCIIKDHQGTLWLGTYFGGVNYFNPEYEIYTWYKPSVNEKRGLSSPIVGRMLEDKHKNLWICTEGGGVNLYNRKSKTFKWYKPDNQKNSISHNNVKAIYYDSKQELMWFGTHLGGLNKLDLKTDKFTHYRYDRNNPTSILSDIVRDIEPYKGKLILATFYGVCIFDPKTEKSTSLFDNETDKLLVKDALDVHIDHKGILWIVVTGEGVFSYNMETKKLRNYRHNPSDIRSISNNNINSIMQDKSNNLYFSTSGRGLDLYRYDTDDFENFDSQKNGLSSDCVYNVYESHDNKLLAITNLGFSTFDSVSKQFHNYNTNNGFPLSTVNENTLYQTQDGEIFLGGVKGMVSFYEKALNFTPKPYDIVFSRLFVNGKTVKVGDDSEILQNSFSQTSSITLQSNHSILSIEFATTNYILANEDEIVYKLEGFSDEWNTIRDQNIITYTNLNAGDYKLVLKNNNGSQERMAILNIKVLPPYYKSTLAYVIYSLLTLAILYFIIRSYKSRIKLKTSLIYEQKHLQDTEELNQSKLRFFTNISHEFRTPLTLIIGQLESLFQTQEFAPAVYKKILKVYNNSLQLKELISELLDFRKQEQGHMKIAVSENNIVDFLYTNYLHFEEYAATKKIKFSFNKEEDSIHIWYDSKQMKKVVNNLLSNAFKYTDAGDSIWINVRKNYSSLVIEIGDSGIGIDKKETDRIFERFYQGGESDSANSGTGIGLALSKAIVELHGGRISVESQKGEKTIFTVSLKLGSEHFDPEQIDLIDEQNTIGGNYKLDMLQSPEHEAIENIYPSKQHKTMKMLIVEDNLALTKMLVEIFEPFYQIITALDGKEGLEMVKSDSPNIVLSDVVMPKMTGIELCKAIKEDIESCHIPVVLLTAKAAVEHNLEGLRFGADDYIAKPFNVSILIQRCNNLINSRIMLQEKFSKQPQATPQMLATNALDKAFLDKATRIIDEHIEEPEFSINDFASEIGMSRSKLFTKLKAVTGQTPNSFLLIFRLKKAAILLKNNPELSISDISTQVGFSSSRYFSKCFKDEYHLNPMAYRSDDTTIEEEPEL